MLSKLIEGKRGQMKCHFVLIVVSKYRRVQNSVLDVVLRLLLIIAILQREQLSMMENYINVPIVEKF